MVDLSGAYYPTILEVTPTAATTGISNLPLIEVAFSLDMDTSQFTNNTTLNSRVLLTDITSDTALNVTYEDYNTTYRVLQVYPSSSLEVGHTYQVHLQDLESTLNRAMALDFTWTFTIDSSGLGTPTLISPADQTLYVTFPTLSWSAPSGNPTSYEVQVSKSHLFNTESIVHDTIVAAPTTSILPDSTSFTSPLEYFWRVRGMTSSSTGYWTDAWSLYYGESPNADIDTRFTSGYSGEFGITSLTPADAATNLTVFPTIMATFSDTVSSGSVTSATFYVTYQSSDTDITVTPGYVNGTFTISNNVVIFVPTDDIAANTRYTIYIGSIESTGGTTMSVVTQSYFTSYYSPLYADTLSVRAMCGRFAATFTDDIINLLMHKASLDVNRLQQSGDAITMEDIIDPLDTITYDMQSYVTMKAALRIAEMRYFEMMEEADKKKVLGDFSIDDGNAIAELGKLIARLAKDVGNLEAIIRKIKASPKVGTRSGQWNNSERYNDTSVQGLFRSTF